MSDFGDLNALNDAEWDKVTIPVMVFGYQMGF